MRLARDEPCGVASADMSVPPPVPPLRRRLAGWLLVLTAILSVLTAFGVMDGRMAAGTTAWLACLLLLPDLGGRSRWQSGLLILTGGGGIAWGLAQGADVMWERAVAGNSGLIALLIGVGFLQLVALPRDNADRPLPGGPGAFRNTQMGVHLFGAVINLSTVFIVGDRLARQAGMPRELTILLTRSFSAAAFWSPFFAAMAAALVFAPEAKLAHLLATGVPLALAALASTYWTIGRHVTDTLPGYPVRYDSLVLPGVLAGAVLVIHLLVPAVSVIALVTLLAPLLTLMLLVPRGRSGRRAVTQQVHFNLPRMVNELALFLGAGVLAAGLGSVLTVVDGWVPFQAFGALEAWLTLVAMILLAVAGVHPVIGIAAFGALLEPLNPDHSLLAATFLAAWALGVCVSPLSGLTLSFQGRYGVDGLRIARWNAGYTLWMLVLCGIALAGLDTWLTS